MIRYENVHSNFEKPFTTVFNKMHNLIININRMDKRDNIFFINIASKLFINLSRIYIPSNYIKFPIIMSKKKMKKLKNIN